MEGHHGGAGGGKLMQVSITVNGTARIDDVEPRHCSPTTCATPVA